MSGKKFIRGAFSLALVLVMILSMAPVTLVVSAAQTYGLWLSGTQVTSDNMNDIKGDGKSSFNPSTNTLTLNDPDNFGNAEDYMIYSNLNDLTIRGKFNQQSYFKITIMGMTIPVPYQPKYGLFAKGNVTLYGEFTFLGYDTGIVAAKDLTVASGTLVSTGISNDSSIDYGTGIDCSGKLTVANGATLTAEGKGDGLEYASLELGSSVAITTPPSHTLMNFVEEGISKYVVCEGNGNDYATKVVISEATSYELWLDSAQVTSVNKNDILGDGKASFDPATNTLTLNEPTAFNNLNNFYILSKLSDLTVSGNFHMNTSDVRNSCIFSYGNLTLSGNFTMYGKQTAINAKQNVTVKSGSTVSLKGTDSSSAGLACLGKLTLEDSIIKFEGEGGTTAFYMSSYSIGTSLGITTPVSGMIKTAYVNGVSAYTVMNSSGTVMATKAVIEPHETIKYDLYIDMIQVTSDNKSDILEDGGKASFDPGTNTLTLNDPTISVRTQQFIILSQLEDLTIKGSYHMTTAYQTNFGLFAYGNLTLDGNFTFYANTIAIIGKKDLTVNSGSVKAVATADDSIGISAAKMIMNDGLTKIEAEGKTFSILMKEYVLGSALGVTTPVEGKIYTLNYNGEQQYTVIKYDGSGVAEKAVIEPHTTVKYELYIDSRQVTSDNKNDILHDGKASFDPETNTLTLNDPQGISRLNRFVIFSTMDKLTLAGSYHMSDDDQRDFGVYTEGDLTLAGDFTFYGKIRGVVAFKDLTVKSGTLKAVGTGENSIGLASFGKLTIGNGITRVEADGDATSVSLIYHDIGSLVEIEEPVGAYVYQMHEEVTEGSIFVAEPDGPVKHLVLKAEPPLEALEGSGTSSDPYLIQSANDWDRLAAYIDMGGDTSGMYFVLTNDISVTTMVGTFDNPFKGNFEGYYANTTHTLNVDLTSDEVVCAPFRYISRATISLINVTGKVNGALHCSGLVGGINGGPNIIQHCRVGADITTSNNYCGGFVGHGGTYATTLLNCTFYGTITGATRAGTLWGWSDAGSTPVIRNCLDVSNSEHPIGLGLPDPKTNVENTYYTNPNKITGTGRPWSNRGKLAYKVSPDGDAKIYQTGSVGVQWGNDVYAAAGETLLMNGYGTRVFRASAGSFKQNGSNLTLVMPAENVTIDICAGAYIARFEYIDGTPGNKDEGPENLVNGDLSNKWCVSEIKYPISITFKAGGAFVPAGYALVTAGDTQKYPSRNPISWKLEGSNDGTNWTLLTNEENNNTLEAKNYTPYAFSLTNPGMTRYEYYRFTVTANKSGTTFQLSGLYLFPLNNYRIILNNGANGTLSSYYSAAKGEIVPVTATPNSGFALDKLIVKTVSGADVEVNNDNSFVMPGEIVNVYATWKRDGALKGDINLDGEVDSSDAGFALRYDAGMIDLTDEQMAAGDVNGDSDVDSSDATFILRYDAGMIDEL